MVAKRTRSRATAKISCSGGPFGLDLSDRSVVLIMTQGIGTRLTDEKRGSRTFC